MSNALLAWGNAVNGDTAFWDGSSSPDGSVMHLGLPSLGLKWRTTTPFGAVSATLPASTTVQLVALCSHNLTLAATVRVRGYSAGGASLLYDSGTISPWVAGVTAASREGLRWNFIHKLSTATAGVIWSFEISDSGNPDGYLSVGRMFLATRLWQPTVNMLAGAGLAVESNTEIQKAVNGAEWFTDAEPHRVAKFGLQVPESEMLTSGFDLQRTAAGSNREVIFQYDPADTEHSVRRSMLGRLRGLSAIEAPYYGTSKTAFEIKELL